MESNVHEKWVCYLFFWKELFKPPLCFHWFSQDGDYVKNIKQQVTFKDITIYCVVLL